MCLYRSTARASYHRERMTFLVRFDNDTTTVVQGADAYEQEGPLTTFFDRNGAGRLASAFAVRVASFRTSHIVEIRRTDVRDPAVHVA
jgi:hypothetical protein